MSDIVAALRYADVMGVCPPQNWTTRAANELELCRNRIAELENIIGNSSYQAQERIAELEAALREAADNIVTISYAVNSSIVEHHLLKVAQKAREVAKDE